MATLRIESNPFRPLHSATSFETPPAAANEQKNAEAAAESSAGLVNPKWLSREVALAITRRTKRWLEKQVSAGRIRTRLQNTSRNGKPIREYLASSLPLAAQENLEAESAELSTRGLTKVVPIATPRVLLANFTPEAEVRLSLLQTLIQYDADRKVWATEGINSKAQLVARIAAEQGISSGTLWRWQRTFKSSPVDALNRRIRADKGHSRWATHHPLAAEFAASAYLTERISVRQVYEALQRAVKESRISDEALPSYETVRTFLASLNPAMVTLARQGRRKYDGIFAPYVKRDYSQVAANQVWVSDHMVHDVFVQNDLFGARGREHMRLRLTCILDFRSRRPVGYAWCEEGSSRSITTALRHAIARFGPCELFYCDNGKDFQKAAGVVLPRLNMRALHCLKYHPQSKHIERFFRTLHTRFDSLWPTYAGRDAKERSETVSQALAEHGKMLRTGAGPSKSSLPLASEFIRACIAWIEADYVYRPHSGQGMDGRAPQEVFEQESWVAQQPPPPIEDLVMLLAERVTRRVRAAAIEIEKSRYIGADEVSSAQMHNLTTREVQVAYDPCDPDFAAALDADGHLLAWLKRELPLGFYPIQADTEAEETRANVEASMQERSRLRRATRESVSNLARRTRPRGYKSAFEVMRDRAALPVAVGSHITQHPVRLRAQIQDPVPPTATEIAAQFWKAAKP